MIIPYSPPLCNKKPSFALADKRGFFDVNWVRNRWICVFDRWIRTLVSKEKAPHAFLEKCLNAKTPIGRK